MISKKFPATEVKLIGISSKRFSTRTRSGRKVMLKTKLKVILSIESISLLFVKKASERKYPGTKSTTIIEINAVNVSAIIVLIIYN